MYRKGIYGHSQMLRVHLRKAFSAGIVSVKKGKQTQLLVAKRNRRYQFSFLFFISKYLLRIQGPRINIYLKLISREKYTEYRFNFEFIISDLILSNSIFHYYIKTNIMIYGESFPWQQTYLKIYKCRIKTKFEKTDCVKSKRDSI